MDQHRWVAVGAARISTAQARDWAHAASEVSHEPLAVEFGSVICAVCLQESTDEVGPECPGAGSDDGRLDHAWRMTLTAPISDDTDEPFDPGIPHAVSVGCVLCGAVPDDADTDCPERALWVGPAVGVPDDAASLELGGRVPRYALRSGVDGDLHVVAAVDEHDAAEWRLFERKSDGHRVELRQERFSSTGFGEYEGRPAWFVGNDFTVEMHVPGRPTPYVITGGRTERGWGSREVPPGPDA